MPTYTANLGLGELWTLLFRKKLCPVCGTKLVRHSDHITDPQPRWHNDGGGFRWQFWYGTEVKVTPRYVCEKCRVTYSLAQLGEGTPGDPLPVDGRGQQ